MWIASIGAQSPIWNRESIKNPIISWGNFKFADLLSDAQGKQDSSGSHFSPAVRPSRWIIRCPMADSYAPLVPWSEYWPIPGGRGLDVS